MPVQVEVRYMDEMRHYPETLLPESLEYWPSPSCDHCDEPIDVGSTIWVATWSESRGEFWGAPCSETMQSVWCNECAHTLGKPVMFMEPTQAETDAEERHIEALEKWWYEGGPDSGLPCPKMETA